MQISLEGYYHPDKTEKKIIIFPASIFENPFPPQHKWVDYESNE